MHNISIIILKYIYIYNIFGLIWSVKNKALCYWIHANILFLKMLARSPPVAVTLELTANHDPSSPKHIRKANYDP